MVKSKTWRKMQLRNKRYKAKLAAAAKSYYNLDRENDSFRNELATAVKSYNKLLIESESLRNGLAAAVKSYNKLQRENESLRNELAAAAKSYNKLQRENESLRNELADAAKSYNKLLKENKSLRNEVWLKPMQAYRPVISYDPQIMFEFKPELCPRFPEKRETLSLDAGFAQTPFLKKILGYYEFKASSPHLSTTSNDKDLGVVSSKIAPAVVAVSTFFGLERKCDCSGLVIRWSSSEKEATILTSAKVLINPKDSKFEFHLIVRMPDGTLLLAKEEHVDYYYNLLTLKVKPIVEPEVVDLRSSQAVVVDGMKVTSLGRSFYTSALYDSIGKLSEVSPGFGCGELLTSNCGNHEIGEGGPLVTDAEYVVGINFFDHHQCTHPLPTPTILSCLEMWKSSSTVMRPWFGIQVVDVNYLSELLSVPAAKVTVSNRDFYVFVKKVYEGSVACKNNIGSCDSVFTLNGIKIESVKQYSQILSKASQRAAACDSGHRLMAVINPYDRPTDDIIIEADYISVDDKRFSVCWPQVKVDEWLHDKSGLRNPGYHWPPAMPDDIC